jgi:hypothetical protein
MKTKTLKVGNIVKGTYTDCLGKKIEYIGNVYYIYSEDTALIEKLEEKDGNRWLVKKKSDGSWGGYMQNGTLERTNKKEIYKTIECPIIENTSRGYGETINKEDYNWAKSRCQRKIKAKKLFGKEITSKARTKKTE